MSNDQVRPIEPTKDGLEPSPGTMQPMLTEANASRASAEPHGGSSGRAGWQSAAPRHRVSAERNLRFRTAAEIAAQTAEEVPWIAQPWVAAGSITEVVGKPKAAGKTTWVMRLVRAVLDGAAF